VSNIPSELKYTETHEWVHKNDDGTVTIGITDHAQSLLGDLVFIELPELNSAYTIGDESGVVESVKAASDIYSPVTGEVVETNEALVNNPELVNSDPYGDGWLFRLKPDDLDELNELLSADEYKTSICEEEESA
jgi:glycine cleavage system H protein